MHLIHSLFQFLSPRSLSLSFLFYLPLLFSFSHAHPILAKQKTMRIRLNTESTKREKDSGRVAQSCTQEAGWRLEIMRYSTGIIHFCANEMKQWKVGFRYPVACWGDSTQERIWQLAELRPSPSHTLRPVSSTNARPCCCAGITNTRDCHSR